MKIKEVLFNNCLEHVTKRLATVETIISSNKKALESETKSSAGDKHETSRAMLQLEMEKAGMQLKEIYLMKQTLSKIDVSKEAENICLGSVVKTTMANYFLAVSTGSILCKNETYYAISVASPIGTLLLGKQKGDHLIFNNNKISILEVL